MNIKYLEAMQIEVTNASIKPRNNSLTIFDIEKYPKTLFQFICTQKYRFLLYSNPEKLDIPPRMCMYWVLPWVQNAMGNTDSNAVKQSNK